MGSEAPKYAQLQYKYLPSLVPLRSVSGPVLTERLGFWLKWFCLVQSNMSLRSCENPQILASSNPHTWSDWMMGKKKHTEKHWVVIYKCVCIKGKKKYTIAWGCSKRVIMMEGNRWKMMQKERRRNNTLTHVYGKHDSHVAACIILIYMQH